MTGTVRRTILSLVFRPTGVATLWTSAGQVVTVVSLLVFAAFSGPRPLSLLAAGSAGVAVVNAVSTLGVEFVLPVAPAGELSCLYRRAAIALACSTLASGFLSFGIMVWLDQPWWVSLVIAAGVVGLALGQFLGAAVVRHRRVALVGVYRFAGAVVAAVAQAMVLLLGEAHLPWGLFTAYVAGNAVVSAGFALYVLPGLRAEARAPGSGRPVSYDHLRAAAASLLNIGALQGPAIVWPAALGTTLAGQWALVGKVMNAPTSLATGPFSNSFIAETANLIRHDRWPELDRVVRRWRRCLLAYGTGAGALTAAAAALLPLVLGDEWSRMRILIPLGLFYAVSQCAVAPTGQILNLIGRSGVQLIWDAARAIAIVVLLVACPHGLPMLSGYAALMAAFYGLLHLITTHQIRDVAPSAEGLAAGEGRAPRSGKRRIPPHLTAKTTREGVH